MNNGTHSCSTSLLLLRQRQPVTEALTSSPPSLVSVSLHDGSHDSIVITPFLSAQTFVYTYIYIYVGIIFSYQDVIINWRWFILTRAHYTNLWHYVLCIIVLFLGPPSETWSPTSFSPGKRPVWAGELGSCNSHMILWHHEFPTSYTYITVSVPTNIIFNSLSSFHDQIAWGSCNSSDDGPHSGETTCLTL